MKLDLGGYVLEADPARTRKTYLEIGKGGAEECGCSYCRNYLAVLPSALPEQVLSFFSAAGIDVRKDAEIYEQGEVSPGMRSYGGEYYLWGSVVTEPIGEQTLPNGFRFAFTKPTPLAQEQFKSEGALCFYFTANLPWVLKGERA